MNRDWLYCARRLGRLAKVFFIGSESTASPVLASQSQGTVDDAPSTMTAKSRGGVRSRVAPSTVQRGAMHSFARVLLIPEFCPAGQRQRLTVNNSTLLVENDSKQASKPIESPHSVPGPCIQQNSLFVAAWSDFLGTEQAAYARSWDFLLFPCQKCRKREELMSISRLDGHM